jgi:hypothetical protein
MNRGLRPDPVSHTSTGFPVAPFQGRQPLIDLGEVLPTDAMGC